MKKTILVSFTLAVLVMIGTASAQTTANLIAGGGNPLYGMDVGEVAITNDGTNLIVTITIDTGDWELVESHVHAAEAVAAIPQTKKGNARPGRFDYCELDPEATSVSPTEHIYTIPLDAIGDEGVELGDAIVVAVHAAIEYTEDDTLYEETAWGQGPEISEGRDWAMYIEFTIPDPDLVVSDITLDSATVIDGDLLAFTYTVANVGGEGPIGLSVFDVAGYLSTDDVLDEFDTMILGPGGSSGTYSVWSDHLDVGWSDSLYVADGEITAGPGEYYLIMVVDATDAYPGVVESNEDNNTLAIAFTVLAPL